MQMGIPMEQTGIPVATAYPVDAQQPAQGMATFSPNNLVQHGIPSVAPEHRGPTLSVVLKGMSRGKKLATACCGFLFVAFGLFIFTRVVLMGCGCPEELSNGRRLQATHSDNTCMCDGDIFSCTWTCGNTCYSGGEATSCDGGPIGPSGPPGSSSGGAGTVTCAGESTYCDCAGDCGYTMCSCSEAQASGCCGSGR